MKKHIFSYPLVTVKGLHNEGRKDKIPGDIMTSESLCMAGASSTRMHFSLVLAPCETGRLRHDYSHFADTKIQN